MLTALFTLAGFFAAHAVWCVAEGETLIPIVAYVDDAGERHMFRLEEKQLEESVAHGRDWLRTNPEKAAYALLIYDGFVDLPGGKTDALILEAVTYGKGGRQIVITVPYRNAKSPRGFAVHRPKFSDSQPLDPQQAGKDFFAGVHEHSQGAAIWASHLDESR